jgi:DNA end-binding protein Ku
MAATVWKGFISFGLVSFPVRLFAAARPQGIHFHMLHKKDLSRVKEVLYCAAEDRPITRADIVKGAEVSKGEYVVVTDEELKKVEPPTASTMDILQFVRSGDVDPIFFESSYYVAPEEAVSKPYALLMHAMTEAKHYAVAKITMHGREHIAIIRPTPQGLVLHTMYFVDELQKKNAPAISKNGKFSAKEIELAKSLIHTLAGSFKPEEYRDQYRENVQHLLDQKQRGQKITPVGKPRTKPVVNIIEALQRSLAQSQKARSETAGSKTKRSRKAA